MRVTKRNPKINRMMQSVKLHWDHTAQTQGLTFWPIYIKLVEISYI